jgi:hypothetical protein
MTLKEYAIRQMLDIEMLNQAKAKGDRHRISFFQDWVAVRKREYRAALKGKNRTKRFRGTNSLIVNSGGDYDSWWIKVFFPGESWTDEEKDEFIAYAWIPYRWSPYDCTGQTFTQSISCFNVPSGVVAYVREALDV